MSAQFSFIARRRQCGCIVAAVLDKTAEGSVWQAEVARDLSEWVLTGHVIERVPNEVVRAAGVGCRCGESGTLSGMEE